MNHRFVFLSLLPMLIAAAPVGRAKALQSPPVPLPDIVRVAITTDLGTIILDLDNAHAPVTTANFIRYVDQKRFDGTTFYRAMRLDWGTPPNGLVQGGPRGDPKRVLKPIAHEPTSQTGILHKAGTISMARFAPGSATADFTILVSDMPGLDADPKTTDADTQAGYAAFGHVVDGMDVVRKIFDAPLSATAGDGILKGQMLAPPIRIVTVRRPPQPRAAK